MVGNGVIDEARGLMEGVHGRLDRIAELVDSDQGYFKYLGASGPADASNNANFAFTPPPGVTWLVRKITASGTASTVNANSAVTVHLDSRQGPRVEYSLLDINGVAVRGPGLPLFVVPPGRTMLVAFFLQTIGLVCQTDILVEEIVDTL